MDQIGIQNVLRLTVDSLVAPFGMTVNSKFPITIAWPNAKEKRYLGKSRQRQNKAL